MSTETGRAFARAVAAAQREAQNVKAPPPRPIHTVTLPLSVLDTATRILSGYDALLYLHLWSESRRYAPNPRRRWMYHEDARLQRHLGVSQPTLKRARAALRADGLLTTTTNQGHKGIPTWYLLTWPVPLPHACPLLLAPLYLDELAAYGHPVEGLPAWVMLAEQDARAVHEAHAYAAQPSRSNYQRLRRTRPWLADQLQWADPRRYLAYSQEPRLMPLPEQP